MKVFKFGGASVKDSAGIKNVAEIIKRYAEDKTLVIVSATGKTTNALEEVIKAYYTESTEAAIKKIEPVKENHLQICNGLFEDYSAPIYSQIDAVFKELYQLVENPKSNNYNLDYDQIVSKGELLSSIILSSYLNHAGLKNQWLDIRTVLKTDNSYREGIVDWKQSTDLCNQILNPLLHNQTVVAQGFIGQAPDGTTTTLGREGSDYTAAIFANLLDAESQTIWKDVPGVMSGDPRKFQDTVLIDELTYLEAVEMTYYGASVIHPKTIKPIQNKGIPLLVKSFINPEGKGTVIHNTNVAIKYPPVKVLKENQVLLTFHTKDFSFVPDDTVGELLKAFSSAALRANMLQTGAISLQTVVDNIPEKIEKVVASVSDNFNIQKEEGLSILTIRNYNDEVINYYNLNKQIILTQKRASTYQILFN